MLVIPDKFNSCSKLEVSYMRVLQEKAPIVSLAEQYGEGLEGQDVSFGNNAYVSYLEDAEQLKAILQRLCPVQQGVSVYSPRSMLSELELDPF
jgi:hypothetical protein